MGESTKSMVPVDGPAADALAETVDGASAAGAQPGRVVLPIPHRIGRYVVLRHLGQGGMGVVFAAYDEELDRKVAIKLLREAELAGEQQRTRILREAQAMARISDPHVVHVYEIGEVAGQVFIAMELVEGTTLTAWQNQSQRTWEEVLRMYRAAGQGLLAAHRVGLVHRDFKPDNVLVGGDGQPRVADFGLARTAGREELRPSQEKATQNSSPRRLLSTSVTMAGALVGTPAYMSPEQYCGEPADSRSDQFSFCAALYEALYKKLPFEGAGLEELSGNVVMGRINPVLAAGPIPALVEQALRRGLLRDPAHRFPSMAELLAALSIDPQRDPAGAAPARRKFTAVMGALIATGMVVNLSRARWTLTTRHLLAGSVIGFLALLIGAWALRGTLGRNAFHRGLVKLVIMMMAQMVGVRTVGMIVGLSPAQLAAIDLISMAGPTLIINVQYLPFAWPLPVLLAGGAILLSLYPVLLWPVLPAIYPALALGFLLAWNRAANRSATVGSDRA